MDVPPLLRSYVRSLTAYDVDAGSAGMHRGIPGPDLVLELALDEPLDVQWRDRPGTRRRTWALLSGLHTTPAQIRMPRRSRGLSVRLTPQGSRTLFGVPGGALAGELVALDEVAPPLACLPERLAGTARPADLLLDRLADQVRRQRRQGDHRAIDAALWSLRRGDEVRRVAETVGWSRRRLQDLVRRECGLAPRDLRRVSRLARSRTAVLAAHGHRDVTLADVAAASGYSDHAHLTREWRDLAGCTPTTFLREEFPYVQDVSVPGRAG